jgi:two-component system chemotaxis response regulator CheB
VVAVAASAGGVQALSEMLAGLPADFSAAVVVVQHLDPNHRSHLVEILGRRTRLPVVQARDGDRLEPGLIVVAPPGAAHLAVGPRGALALEHSAARHHVRPSADRLFESLAESFGRRAAAVVLTGMGRDGAAGASAVKRMGGRVIAQDEATSAYFGMPGAAIATGHVDRVLALDRIADHLVEVVADWRLG